MRERTTRRDHRRIAAGAGRLFAQLGFRERHLAANEGTGFARQLGEQLAERAFAFILVGIRHVGSPPRMTHSPSREPPGEVGDDHELGRSAATSSPRVAPIRPRVSPNSRPPAVLYGGVFRIRLPFPPELFASRAAAMPSATAPPRNSAGRRRANARTSASSSFTSRLRKSVAHRSSCCAAFSV